MSSTASRLNAVSMRAPRLLTGVLISLCLHGLLILAYLLAKPTAPEQRAPASRMTVWLQPLVKPRAPAAAAPALATTQRLPERRASLTTKPDQPRKASTPLASSAASVPAAAEVVAAAAPDSQTSVALQEKGDGSTDGMTKQAAAPFDVNAALKMARKQASVKDPARAALPVAQLDDHPLYPADTSSKLARDIQQSTRPDCRKGGSIFSPLIWLLDKKDSGCKF